jgi:hypothetical protein
MDALRVPHRISDLLDRRGEGFQDLLGENLIGLYLHGSLTFDCFHPETSDIDFLVVVHDRLDVATRRHITHALIAWSRDAPPRGLETSIVTQESLRAFRYPTPFEFHFSNAWRDRYVADEVDLEAERVDPDLAAHLTVVRERGIRLVGEPIEAVIPSIPREAYLRSIANDAAGAGANIAADPVYGLLNLCRVLTFLHDGRITSKAEGGQWAMRHLPATFVPLVHAALEAYTHGEALRLAPEEPLHAFAAYVARQIDQALPEQ